MARAPVCIRCYCDFKIEESGVYCVETAGRERRPHQVWKCDMWKCPKCGVEILQGFGQEPLMVGEEKVRKLINELSKDNDAIVMYTNEYWQDIEARIYELMEMVREIKEGREE